MNYKFYGDQFYFTKYCNSTEQVQETIKRCSRPFRTRTYTLFKRVNKVVDELGIIIFERKRYRR